MATVYFDEGERPVLEDKDVIGTFYDAGDNREMLAYIHRDWKEGDELPILDAMPDDIEVMKEMLNTRSFLMTENLAKRFMDLFNEMAKHGEEDGSVDTSEG